MANHEPMLGWHFCASALRDGRPIPPDGETLIYDGPLEMCVTGLHASERIIDALQYAPGNTICRVECRGKIAAVLGSQALLWTGMGRIDGNLAQISGQLAHIEQTVAR